MRPQAGNFLLGVLGNTLVNEYKDGISVHNADFNGIIKKNSEVNDSVWVESIM